MIFLFLFPFVVHGVVKKSLLRGMTDVIEKARHLLTSVFALKVPRGATPKQNKSIHRYMHDGMMLGQEYGTKLYNKLFK